MKKLKRFSKMLLIISSLLFIAFVSYDTLKQDKEPPVITCPESELKVSVSDKEDVYLKDVTAKDNKDGDVSDSVVVEKISAFTDEGYRIITYAAIDEYGNVGRATRKLKYTDYTKPVIYLNDDLRIKVDDYNADIRQHISATSELDGDISSKVKVTESDDAYIWEEGTMELELSVTDSAGTKVTLPVKLDIYNPKEEEDLLLSEYIVYLDAESEFDAMSYYNDNYPSEDINIESNVDMANAGVYDVVYSYEMDKMTRKARLVVVVL